MFKSTPVDDVVGRRAGRLVFGAVLCAGAVVLVMRHSLGLDALEVMLLSWSAACLLGVAARFAVPELWRIHRPESFAMAGAVVPAIGVALMAPLMIQLPFALMLAESRAGFDDWVSLSIVITGTTHVALAIMLALRAARLVHGKRPQSIWSVYVVGIIVSCVPFAVFVLPPILTALTGLPFIGLMMYQDKLAGDERHELAAELALPRAVLYAA